MSKPKEVKTMIAWLREFGGYVNFQEIADDIGVSKSLINKIKAGRAPSLIVKRAIVSLFDKKWNRLMG